MKKNCISGVQNLFHLIFSCTYLELLFQAVSSSQPESTILFLLAEFPHGRKVLVKLFTILIADVSNTVAKKSKQKQQK
jgi:hypothetical protein